MCPSTRRDHNTSFISRELLNCVSMKPGEQGPMPKDSSIISASPEIMGGTPVFAGTRVPIQTLLDYLKAGESIGDFLDGFPTVTKEQVISFLEEAGKQLVGMA